MVFIAGEGYTLTPLRRQDGDEDREGRIRVGKDYQVSPPDFIPPEKRRPELLVDRALLVWEPSSTLSNAKIDEYVQLAKEKYGYNSEQALGMLFWHRHDMEKALADLSNFAPFPDEWSSEDKVLFDQAFQFHGKSFHRIRQMLPDKTIAQLVKHYYNWKKTRSRVSTMDKLAKKYQQRYDPSFVEDPAEVVSDEFQDKLRQSNRYSSYLIPKPRCSNCGIICHITYDSKTGKYCGTCYNYLEKHGQMRPTLGPPKKDKNSQSGQRSYAIMRGRSSPPKGMYINHDDLMLIATGSSSRSEQIMKTLEREIISLKRAVQSNKQMLSFTMRRNREKNIDRFRIPEPQHKINPKWTHDELLLGVQGVRHYGKNFKAISEVLGTKTESHVRSFFVTNRKRFNLDAALKEYELEHGPSGPDDMDVDNKSGSDNSNQSSGPPSPGASNSGPRDR